MSKKSSKEILLEHMNKIIETLSDAKDYDDKKSLRNCKFELLKTVKKIKGEYNE